jgi:hypothetical protein
VSAQSSSLLGYGLYFIDVLACLLFCITLALVGARFGHELTVPVDLPSLEDDGGTGSGLDGPSIAMRSEAGELWFYLDGETVTLEELETRLRAATPPSVTVRSEESALSRVIAIAHAAGVADIQLAYEAERGKGELR